MASLLRNNAYRTIRQRLLNRDLAPGTRVSELALAKEMGISRAPVREAINQLASEGLVMQIPNSGTFVKQPSRIDIENLFQVRIWLEEEAAAETARHVSERRVAKMQESLDQMKTVVDEHIAGGEEFLSTDLLNRNVSYDLAFHLGLLRGCGNRMVSKLASDHHMMSQIWCAMPEANDATSLARTYEEHLGIFRAVQEGDCDLARRLMREHLEVACSIALKRYDWNQRQQSAEEIDWPDANLPMTEDIASESGIRSSRQYETNPRNSV